MESNITDLVKLAAADKKSELEVKVLIGQIHTREDAERVVRAIEEVTTGGFTEEHRATFRYPDDLRVVVTTPENIFKVCSSNSFRNVDIVVERKEKYFPQNGGVDTVDIPDFDMRVTLRKEEILRKDFTGSPSDPKTHVRVLHRKSWKTPDQKYRIDLSLVKSKSGKAKTLSDILRSIPAYELEIEVLDGKGNVAKELLTIAHRLTAAHQQSVVPLSKVDIRKYKLEFENSRIPFLNPVTMVRRHIAPLLPHNILKGYTVTNKADGERSMLVVARDRKLIRWTRKGTISWTGLTAKTDKHVGDVIDGEYLESRNLFCIFDVYSYKGVKVSALPLMTSDDDVPEKSRVGYARLFVESISKDFTIQVSPVPFRVETKLFLSGDGPIMETAIKRMLDTKFEYATDGLVFTPKSSSVAPPAETRFDTWTTVYKWKPPHQNSIDFLVQLSQGESVYDPVTLQKYITGTLYVTRTPGTDIIYPCETMTGEYSAPRVPTSLGGDDTRVPAPFQPSSPKAPDASRILIPVNERGIPVDIEGHRVEDKSIIECSRDVENGRWVLMRTRHDKTYQYRVLHKPVFGNSILTAEDIWTNIHNPVTEDMLRVVYSNPTSDTAEDDLYYQDSLETRDRAMKNVQGLHNQIKETLYRTFLQKGSSLLELAMGRGGDMHKWRSIGPSLIVGIDLSTSNLEAPRQGACVRYLKAKQTAPMPPALFIAADMTQPLMEQDNRYLRILGGKERPPTPYLEKFAGKTDFDAVSCQFAIHYACESEESFRKFLVNLTTHCKGVFFGTCMDGKAVYSLLLGKGNHMFKSGKNVWGEITKEYADGDGWSNDFGHSITVRLESFEKPQKEYLVPFDKITTILTEEGFELVQTEMFDDTSLAKMANLEKDQKAFSSLHRLFAFKRGEKPRPVVKEEDDDEMPGLEYDPEAAAANKAAEEAEKAAAEASAAPKEKKKRLTKKKEPEGPPPALFFMGNESLTEFRGFENGYDAKIVVDGVTFPTVEHYYQWSKAKAFGDADTEKKILKTASSKSVKTYGKKVKNFEEDKWDEKKLEVMKTALRAKFTQHPELRDLLLSTKDRPLGEADPRDKYWSIGTGADTAKAKDPSKWPGKNMLGKLLSELRDEFTVA